MGKISGILVVFMLFASLSFAWNTGWAPPSCASVYTVLGVNFTIDETTALCTGNTSRFAGINATSNFFLNDAGSGATSTATGGLYRNGSLTKLMSGIATKALGGSSFTATGFISIPNDLNNYTFTYATTDASGAVAQAFFGLSFSGAKVGSGTINSSNSTHYFVNSTNAGNAYITKGGQQAYSVGVFVASGGGGEVAANSYIQFSDWPTNTETNIPTAYPYAIISNPSIYVSTNGNNVIRSDFKTGGNVTNTSSLCKDLVYYGTTLLIPKITYFPGQDAFAYLYNTTNNAAFLKNNTVNYILDANSGQWYAVTPPFTCPDFTNVYSASATLYPYSSTQTTTPQLYLIQNCYANTLLNSFTWDIKSTSSRTFNLTKTYTSGNVTYTTNQSFTGTQYTGSINMTNTTNITILDNGQVVCSYMNGTSTFFSSIPFISNYNLTNVAGKFMIVVMAGITVPVPFAAVGVIFMNDLFGSFTQSDLFLILACAVSLSFIINSFHERSLKVIGIYVVVAVGIVGYMLAMLVATYSSVNVSCIPSFMQLNANGQYVAVAGLQNSMNTIASFFNGNVAPWFAVGAVVQMFVEVVIFVVSLPLYIWSGILSPLACINPNLANAVAGLSGMALFGIPMYIYLKGYEAASNKYRNI